MTNPMRSEWSLDQDSGSSPPIAAIHHDLLRLVRQALLWLGILNVVALAGLYAYMSSRAETIGRNAALAATEEALRLVDVQAAATQAALSDALVRSGELRQRTDEIALGIENLAELPSQRVFGVASLIRKNDRELRELVDRDALASAFARLEDKVEALEDAEIEGSDLAADTIGTRHLRDGSITRSKLDPGLVAGLLPGVTSAESPSTSEWSHRGEGPERVLVTGPLAVETPRPVLIQLVDSKAASPSWLGGSADVVVDVRIARDETPIWYGRFTDATVAPSAISVLDFPPEGEHVYSLTLQKVRGSEISLHHVKLVATRL